LILKAVYHLTLSFPIYQLAQHVFPNIGYDIIIHRAFKSVIRCIFCARLSTDVIHSVMKSSNRISKFSGGDINSRRFLYSSSFDAASLRVLPVKVFLFPSTDICATQEPLISLPSLSRRRYTEPSQTDLLVDISSPQRQYTDKAEQVRKPLVILRICGLVLAGAEGIEPSAYGFGGLHGRPSKRLLTGRNTCIFFVQDASRCLATIKKSYAYYSIRNHCQFSTALQISILNIS